MGALSAVTTSRMHTITVTRQSAMYLPAELMMWVEDHFRYNSDCREVQLYVTDDQYHDYYRRAQYMNHYPSSNHEWDISPQYRSYEEQKRLVEQRQFEMQQDAMLEMRRREEMEKNRILRAMEVIPIVVQREVKLNTNLIQL